MFCMLLLFKKSNTSLTVQIVSSFQKLPDYRIKKYLNIPHNQYLGYLSGTWCLLPVSFYPLGQSVEATTQKGLSIGLNFPGDI